MAFGPLSCSWGVAQKHHSYKEYLAKANSYDPSKVQRVLKKKNKQPAQKKYFERRCKPLEPRKRGDIRVRQGATWEPAELLGKSSKGEPRSHIVRAMTIFTGETKGIF